MTAFRMKQCARDITPWSKKGLAEVSPIKCFHIYLFFRLPKTNVNSSNFSFSTVLFSNRFLFKSGTKFLRPLSFKFCLLRYRGNNNGTKVKSVSQG